MSRQPHAGGRYISPIKQSDGTTPTEGPRGAFLLAANTTYIYPLASIEAPFVSVHLTGLDDALIITSATIRDCNHGELDVADTSTTAGDWIAEDPTTAFVGADGAGWTPTNGVLAVAGGAVGGAMWHIGETGAARTILEVVVGGTGGKVRVSGHGKD